MDNGLKIKKNLNSHHYSNWQLHSFFIMNWLGDNMDLKAYTGPQVVWYHIKGPYCSTLNIFFCITFSENAINK